MPPYSTHNLPDAIETERRDRLEALHHDLNAAINYHRRRFPESSWADVLKALEATEGQIRKKIR
jgi:hypothetical protein